MAEVRRFLLAAVSALEALLFAHPFLVEALLFEILNLMVVVCFETGLASGMESIFWSFL